MIFPVLCLFNILCFFLSLNRGNLLVDWATTVASLRNGLDCWVCLDRRNPVSTGSLSTIEQQLLHRSLSLVK